MTEPDPECLGHNRPAFAYLDDQGAVFVADAKTLDNGWLRVREWRGQSVKLPPHRVQGVRYLDTERYGDRREHSKSKPKRIADTDWRERAVEWTKNGENPVVADD
jgi:hypothetical protein